MEMLNRSALLITPKRRFLEWANGLPDTDAPVDVDELPSFRAVYLVAWEDEEPGPDLQDIVDAHADQIWEFMLSEWVVDEALWPANRTPHTLRDWFGIEMVDTVVDADPFEPLTFAEVERTHCAMCQQPLSDAPLGIALVGTDLRRLTADEITEWDRADEAGTAYPFDADGVVHCCGPACLEQAEQQFRLALEQAPPSA